MVSELVVFITINILLATQGCEIRALKESNIFHAVISHAILLFVFTDETRAILSTSWIEDSEVRKLSKKSSFTTTRIEMQLQVGCFRG